MCIFSKDEQFDVHIERITKDVEFWKDCINKADHFIRTAILPELLRKWYACSNKVYAVSFDTSTPSSSGTGSDSNSEPVYCYCKKPEEDEMIGYDNTDCSIVILNVWKYVLLLKGSGTAQTAHNLQEERKPNSVTS